MLRYLDGPPVTLFPQQVQKCNLRIFEHSVFTFEMKKGNWLKMSQEVNPGHVALSAWLIYTLKSEICKGFSEMCCINALQSIHADWANTDH